MNMNQARLTILPFRKAVLDFSNETRVDTVTQRNGESLTLNSGSRNMHLEAKTLMAKLSHGVSYTKDHKLDLARLGLIFG